MNTETIKIDARLLKVIEEMGYEEYTPIQLGCIPEIQAGKDVIGQSSTGSGKTAAFGLPIIEKVHPNAGIQALILTPTRELCVQVADSLATFAKYTSLKVAAVYGGVGINPQKDDLRRVEIVVGTPGRILDHMRQGSVNFSKVKFFVLDETDRMCDMGFYEDVEIIVKAMPKQRQTLLFSATYTRDVDKIIAGHMNSPVKVQGEARVDPSLLDQVYYDIAPSKKFATLVYLLKQNLTGLSMVFCRTRSEVDVVARNLKQHDVHAMPIHGGLTQARRLKALEMLRREHVDVLVATDVAARGLDVKGVSYIYNYDVPPTPDEYIHRIGRTARAGKNGRAITLLVPADHYNFRSVLLDSSLKVRRESAPEVEAITLQRQPRFARGEGSGFGARGFGAGRGGFGNRGGGSRFHTSGRGFGGHAGSSHSHSASPHGRTANLSASQLHSHETESAHGSGGEPLWKDISGPSRSGFRGRGSSGGGRGHSDRRGSRSGPHRRGGRNWS